MLPDEWCELYNMFDKWMSLYEVYEGWPPCALHMSHIVGSSPERLDAIEGH